MKAMVYIPADFLCQMLIEVNKNIPNETGGLIAGKMIGKSKWIVTHITLPGPSAAHSRFSFKPDYEYDEKEIARIYEETDCESVYLGDWHSHPNSNSYMSEKDKNVLRTIARSKQARMPYPIMVVLGTSPLQLFCWTYIKPKLLEKEFVQIPISLLKS